MRWTAISSDEEEEEEEECCEQEIEGCGDDGGVVEGGESCVHDSSCRGMSSGDIPTY